MSFSSSDEQLLEALDRLVEEQDVVKAGERLSVDYRTAVRCLGSHHVSRRMCEALQKHLREQGKLGEREGEGTAASAPGADEPEGGEKAHLQEPEHDLRHEVEALRAEVSESRERVEAVEGQAAQGRGRGDDHIDVESVDAVDAGKHKRSVVTPRRVFPELITEEAEPGEKQVYGAAAE